MQRKSDLMLAVRALVEGADLLKRAALAAGDFADNREGTVWSEFRDELERVAIVAGRLAKSTEMPTCAVRARKNARRDIGAAIGQVSHAQAA